MKTQGYEIQAFNWSDLSMREEVEQFVKEEGLITSSTEYEERLIELSRKFAVRLGTVGGSHRSVIRQRMKLSG